MSRSSAAPHLQPKSHGEGASDTVRPAGCCAENQRGEDNLVGCLQMPLRPGRPPFPHRLLLTEAIKLGIFHGPSWRNLREPRSTRVHTLALTHTHTGIHTHAHTHTLPAPVLSQTPTPPPTLPPVSPTRTGEAPGPHSLTSVIHSGEALAGEISRVVQDGGAPGSVGALELASPL